MSRAPLDRVQAYRERMGWGFRWVSSLGNRFNFDYGVSFTEDERRVSVFAKDAAGAVFHTPTPRTPAGWTC